MLLEKIILDPEGLETMSGNIMKAKNQESLKELSEKSTVTTGKSKILKINWLLTLKVNTVIEKRI